MDLLTTLVAISAIFFMVVSGILAIVVQRALRSNRELEDEHELLLNNINEAQDANMRLAAWFEEFKNRVVYSYKRMKSIDEKGAFEADDEVGFFFKELKEIIERLYQLGVIDETEKEEALTVEAQKITTEAIQEALAKRNTATITRKEKK